MIRYGEPLDVARWLQDNPARNRRELTAELESRVRALTPDFRRRRDPLLLSWAAELVASSMDLDPLTSPERSFAEDCQRMRDLQTMLAQCRLKNPETHRALIHRLRSHRSKLHRSGLSPCDVYLCRSPWRTAKLVARELVFALLGLPVLFWGGLNHAPLALTLSLLARKMTTKRNVWSSHALYSSLLVFPAFYALQIGAAWTFLAPIVAACYTLLLPVTGYAALLLLERTEAGWKQVRALAKFMADPLLYSCLRAESDVLRSELVRCLAAGAL